MGTYACPCCMLVFKKNNVFDKWDAIHLLLINDIIVFVKLVLSEDLGSVNLRHELYMYVYAECDLLMILLLMTLIDMRRH